MNPLPSAAADSLTEWLGEGWSARPLAGDASARAYYRVTAKDGRTIAEQGFASMDKDLTAESFKRFAAAIARELAKSGETN